MKNGSYISLKQVAASWLLGRGKTRHSKWKVVRYGVEAVRELKLTSLPMIQHTMLTRAEGQAYWELPEDYMGCAVIGVHTNGAFVPINVSDELVPYLQSGQGAFMGWGDVLAQNGGFSSASFGSGFNTTAVTATGGATATTFIDEVVLNEAQGIIICNPAWATLEIYLQYVSVCTANTLTKIPVIAQKCIEAYISWMWAEAKRDNATEAERQKMEYHRQHALLRARISDISLVDIAKTFYANSWLLEGSGTSNPEETMTVNASTGGSSTPSVAVGINYSGSQSSSTLPTQSQILALTAGAGLEVTFANTTDKYLLFAYPSTQAEPTAYYISAFDNGTLGVGGTFAAPVTVGSYRLIISNYATQVPTPVTFQY